MSKINLRTFRRRLDLDLIPASHSKIILGTLVWDSLLGNPDFDHPGMPNHILNPFQVAGYLSQEEREAFERELKNTPMAEGEFSKWTVDIDFNAAAKFKHPQLGKITKELDFERAQKFAFDDIKVRVMTNSDRIRLSSYLEQLKENNWEDYKGTIRRVFVITELYYGSVSITIDRKFQKKFESNLKQAKLDATSSFEMNRSVSYSFANDSVPFAMNLERVNQFYP